MQVNLCIWRGPSTEPWGTPVVKCACTCWQVLHFVDLLMSQNLCMCVQFLNEYFNPAEKSKTSIALFACTWISLSEYNFMNIQILSHTKPLFHILVSCLVVSCLPRPIPSRKHLTRTEVYEWFIWSTTNIDHSNSAPCVNHRRLTIDSQLNWLYSLKLAHIAKLAMHSIHKYWVNVCHEVTWK